jgi:predicted Rossmann-fold nucleotide-binding protein
MKHLCVFTGSSPGYRPEYAAAARALGEALVTRDLGLVYGGANIGLMGVLADSVLERGGEVVGGRCFGYLLCYLHTDSRTPS